MDEYAQSEQAGIKTKEYRIDKLCAVWMEKNYDDCSQDSNFGILDMHDVFAAGYRQGRKSKL